MFTSKRSAEFLHFKNPEVKKHIRILEEEFSRKGEFEWLFPTPKYKNYSSYFEEERILNKMLSKHLLSKT